MNENQNKWKNIVFKKYVMMAPRLIKSNSLEERTKEDNLSLEDLQMHLDQAKFQVKTKYVSKC